MSQVANGFVKGLHQQSSSSPSTSDSRSLAISDYGLRTEFIFEPGRLQSLEEDWRELWSSLPDATPFQSPEWILPWWSHYGQGPLFSFAFWNEQELVGLAPLYIFSRAQDPIRRVFLIGTGNTDYLDVIFHPAFRRECWQALITAMEAHSDQWDEVSLQRLRKNSPCMGDLEAAKFTATSQQQEPCPVLDLGVDTPAGPMLQTARRYQRKLRNKKEFSIDLATKNSLEAFFRALVRLHESRWQSHGLPGVLQQEQDRSFLHEVARRFLEAGMLRLYGLRVDNAIASVAFAFHQLDRTYIYLTGFDPAYGRMSIGTVVVGHVIERAIAEGASFLDFLKGQESHKYRWGSRDNPVFSRTVKRLS